MPFALIIVGVVLVVAAVRGTTDVLFSLVKNDFTGANNYTYWLASILLIGAIGYIKPLQPLSRIFLALLVVVLVLSHGGLFDKLNAQLFGGTLTPGSGPVTLTGVQIDLSSLKGWNFGQAGSIQSGNQ